MAALLMKTLAVVCPRCDFLNVAGAIRCMSCGAPTDEKAPVATGAGAAPGLAAPPERATAAGAPPPNPMPPPMGEWQPAEPPATPSAPPAPPTIPDAAPVVTQSPPAADAAPAAAQAVAPPGLRRAPAQASPSGLRAPPPAQPPMASSDSRSPAPPAGPRFALTVVAGPARGQRFRLGATGAHIGRSRGAILFPDDPFISPLHSTLTIREGKLWVRAESATTGVYVSIAGQETIPLGGTFATGLRLFRYVAAIEPSPPWNRRDVVVYGAPIPQMVFLVEEILLGDRPGRAIATPGPVITIGQGPRCEFSFPNDEGLAARHCEIAPLPTGAMVRDLSGGLGTYVRVEGERAIKPGERIRVGQQTLQLEAA